MANNDYYNHSSNQPVNSSRGSSSAIRAEFDAIAAAFDKVSTSLSAASSAADFKLIYQGQLASDPTQRYDGSQLQGGDLYFNTTDKVLKSFSDGQWYAIPTSASVILKSGGTFTGAIKGTSAEFTQSVKAAGFTGNGAGLTDFTSTQIKNGLGYTPLDSGGGTMTGALNGTTANYSGAVRASDFIIPSDERLKQKWVPLPAGTIHRLAKIKKAGTYEVKKTGKRKIGVGAQSIAAILPEAVEAFVGDKDKEYLGVQYGSASLALMVEMAKHIVDLEKRLDKRIAAVEKRSKK